MSLVNQHGQEIDLSLYQKSNLARLCPGMQTAFLQSIRDSDINPVTRFITENCAGCNGINAIVVRSPGDDYREQIYILKNASCPQPRKTG